MDDHAHTGHANELAETWLRARPDLRLDDFFLELYLVRLGRIVEQLHNRVSMDLYGLRVTEMRVVLALRRAGPPYARRPTDLYRNLLVTSGAITKQVDRLVALNMVERRPDKSNKGGFLIQLTPEGLKIADSAVEHFSSTPLLGRALDAVSPEDLRVTARTIVEILDRIENPGIPAGD